VKMFTGHRLTKDEIEVPGREVRFVTEDGKEAFAVRIGSDGRSIEVRGVDTFWVEGVAYGSTLQVVPVVSNGVNIEARKYNT
jgi:hypothetical protein